MDFAPFRFSTNLSSAGRSPTEATGGLIPGNTAGGIAADVNPGRTVRAAEIGSALVNGPAPSEWTRIAVMTLVLCGSAGAVDSFDTQMIGFTGTQIAADLSFPVADLGWLFGAGQ